jgi:hypothetical protein
MNKLSVSVSMAMAMCLTASALADVPVYRDQALSIKEALVVTESGTSYYTDIKLVANDDGSFDLVQAERLELAHVREVTIAVDESPSVQVNVQIDGELPNGCYQLEEPAVMREGSTFTIVLAQRVLHTFTFCTQALEPFTLFVPLTVKDLPVGHYPVSVNGIQSGFDLDADN